MNLLLVDEDPAYREILQIRLEAVGCHVKCAHSLDELRALASQSWHLIVSDSESFGMDCDALLKLLNPKLHPCFLYTRQDAAALSSKVKPMGVREVLSKLRRADLIKAIQAFVQPGTTTSTASGAVSAPGRKFLLVDDSPTIRKFVRVILERSFPGSSIFEAEDGKTAMHELTGQKMDLIVTDMQMPGVDGQSFIKTLHRNPLLNKKPIVILSGMVTKEMEKEYGVVPTVRILSKPADPEKIVSTIKTLLQN